MTSAGDLTLIINNPATTTNPWKSINVSASGNISKGSPSANSTVTATTLLDAVRLPGGSWRMVGNNSDGGASQLAMYLDGNGNLEAPLRGTATNTLGGTAAYSQVTGTPALLDADVQLIDADLGAAGTASYAGVTVTLQRSTGANAGDVFGSKDTNGVPIAGGFYRYFDGSSGNISVKGTIIGSFTQGNGTLVLSFSGADATRDLVNTVLRSITYSNTQETPPASVQIAWVANDGNTGAQGVGGAKDSVAGITTVTIVAKPANTAPKLELPYGVTLVEAPVVVAGADTAVGLFKFNLPTTPIQYAADTELIGRPTFKLQYAGTTLTIQRAGGANANDVFGLSSTFTVGANGEISRYGRPVGTMVNSAGRLQIAFNAGADAGDVAYAAWFATYRNIGTAAEPNVQIEVTFSDGNTGQQGTGGAKSTTLTRTVNVAAPAIPPDARTTVQASGTAVTLASVSSDPLPVVYRFTVTDNDANGDGVVDAGSSDALASTMTKVVLQVSEALATSATWMLSGGGISPAATGYTSATSADGMRTVTFNLSGTRVGNAAQAEFSVIAISSGPVRDNLSGTIKLDRIELSAATSQLSATPYANVAAATVTRTVTATQLRSQGTVLGRRTSGEPLSSSLMFFANDANGVTDTDFNGTVTLTASGAGVLSSPAGLTQQASRGMTTVLGLTYTGTVDLEPFTITASAAGLASAEPLTGQSDVVATRLVFASQPAASTALTSGQTATFSTAPVVWAVNDLGQLDTDYTGPVTLALVDPGNGVQTSNPQGSVNSLDGVSDDLDNAPTVVRLQAVGGVASFANLGLSYTNGGSGNNNTLALKATSSWGLDAAIGNTLTSRPANTAPTVDLNGATQVNWTEADSPSATDNRSVVVASGITVSDAEQAVPASITLRLPDAAAGESLQVGDTTASASIAWQFTPGSNDTELTLSARPGGTAPTLADFVATLRGVRYVYDSNSPDTGARTVQITVDDGQSANNTASVEVTVNRSAVDDAPSLTTAPTGQSGTEDSAQALNLAGLGLVDPDGQDSPITLTLQVTAGTLQASSGLGVSVQGSGSDKLLLSGTVEKVGKYLDTAGQMAYTGPANVAGQAAATLTISAEGGSSSNNSSISSVLLGSAAIDITPVNDAPTLAGLPATASGRITVGVAHDLADFTVADVDGDTLTLTLTPYGGVLGGLVDADAGRDGLQLIGTAAAINAALVGATFTANVANAVNVTVALSDATHGASGSHALPEAKHPNTAATLAPALAQNVATGAALGLGFITTADPDSDQTLTLTLDAGGATLRGLQDADSATAGVQLRGSALSINAALAQATLTASADGLVTLSVSVTDGEMASPATATYQVTAANVAPTLSQIATLEGAEEDSGFTISYASLLAASDAADGGGAVQAFVVQAVLSGSLSINGNPWAAGSNDVIDADHPAVWTPAADAYGTLAEALSAFTVQARDNGGTPLLSALAVPVTVAVAALNDAPTLSGSHALAGITEDSAGSTGVQVSSLLGNLTVADAETAGSALGVAVTGSSALGHWQYSVDSTDGSDGTWVDLGEVSASSARLLAATDWLRYVPDQARGETASLTLRAWDGSSGTAHALANTLANGGATAFSADSVTATLAVSDVDDALALTLTDASHATQSYQENADLVLDATLTLNDPDTATTLAGARAYISAGFVSAEDQLLINGSTSGTLTLLGVSITYSFDSSTGVMALDGTASQDAYQAALRLVSYRNTSDNPSTAARTIDLVAGTMLATTLDGQIHFYDYISADGTAGQPRLTWTQARDAAAASGYAGMTGYLVTITSQAENDFIRTRLPGSSWLGASDAAEEGNWQWVTGPEAGQQFWQVEYNWLNIINGGHAVNGLYSNWNSGEPNNALGEDYAQVLNNTGEWNDRTAGPNYWPLADVNGYLVEYSSPSVNTVAFSKSITVTPVQRNDAPVLAAASPTLTAISEDASSNAGQLVSSLVALNTISDADTGAVRGGIAITALDSGNGQWQYRLNNSGDWWSMGTPSDAEALLLNQTDAVRFVPDGANATTGTFSYRAWDGTSNAGDLANATTVGGTSAFSSRLNTASISVTGVNDAPVLADGASVAMAGINEDLLAANNPGQTVASLLQGVASDVDLGASQGVAVVGKAGPGTGVWQYSRNGGSTWTALPTVSDSNALLLTATDRLRFAPDGLLGGTATLTLRAWDGSTGTAGNTPNIGSTLGGSNAYSSTTAAVSLAVDSINDAATATPSGGSAAYTEAGAGVAIDAGLVISDDSATLQSATVRITDGYTYGDRLSFTAQLGISGNFDDDDGTLTLGGSASPADWQAALRSVNFFNNGDDPTLSSATRTLQWTLTDAEGLDSTPATRTLNLTATADAATASGVPATFDYTEDDGARVLAPDLQISDSDDIELASARVTLGTGASGYVAASEQLGLSDATLMTATGTGWTAAVGSIALTYTRSTGRLQLTGTASVTEYRDLLRSVTYSNTQDYRVGGATLTNRNSRSITWQVVDADSDSAGAATAALGSTSITLNDANEVPQVAGADVGVIYTENAAAIPVAAGLSVSSNATLTGASVRIGQGYTDGDVLAMTSQNGITAAWDSNEGLLTLSGSASLTDYQAALQSVTFASSSDNPTAGSATRTLRWQILDNTGTPSAVDAGATTTLTITAVNDAGSVGGLAASGTMRLGETSVKVGLAKQLTLVDVDDTQLASATVVLGGAGFDATAEYLRLPDQTASTGSFSPGSDWTVANMLGSGVAASYVASTGTLSFSGVASVEMYQQLLQRVQFSSHAADPTATSASRSISWTVTDTNGSSAGNGAQASAAAASDVTMLSMATKATLTGLSGTALAVTEGTPMQPGSTIVLADADDTQLAGAQVRISTGFASGDTLAFTDQNGITGSYNAATGDLTLSGTASVADYQAALRSVAYSTGDDPTAKTAKRQISWQVTDANSDGAGAATSLTRAVSLQITATNDAAVITSSATPTFTEGGAAMAIDTGLTLTDADDTQITGASVGITSGLTSGDVLALASSFASTHGISASFNSGTGVLTLTGTATVANYQAVLRAVTFANTSSEPTSNGAALSRAIQWQVTDANSDAAGAATGTATSSITVQAVNAAAQLGAGGSLAYTEGGAAAVLDANITLADADDTQMAGAVLAIISGFTAGDELGFTTQNGISGAYDSDTGVLTLSGTATVAHYQAALRSVRFSSTSDDPTASSSSRTVSIQVTDVDSDGAGAATSNQAGSTVTLTATGDAPVLAGVAASASWAEGSAAQALAPALTLSDADDSLLGQATVRITDRALGDTLSWDATLLTGTRISASFGSQTGVLSLSGNASASAYQAVLRSVAFSSTSADPTVNGTRLSRQIQWTLTDVNGDSTSAGRLDSNTATTSVAVTATNSAPGVTTSVTSASWTEGDAALAIDPGLSLSDGDSANLTGARVAIGSGLAAGDALVFSSQNGISGSYDSATGVLSLSGTATLGQYQAALRSVQFRNSGDNPAGNLTGAAGSRSISWTVSDDFSPAGTSAAATSTLVVKGVNDAPTFSAMSGAVGSGVEDGASVAFTLADLLAAGNAADVDGTITALRVTQVSGGTLRIGSSEATATAWNARTNATINASQGAWWTPAANANGATLAAFKLVAVDNQGAESPTAVQVRTAISAVADAAVVTGVALPAAGTYAAGDALDFTLNFDRAVTVDTTGGTPQLAVTLDNGWATHAQYLSGSGSTALVFRMTVATGALDADGITVAGSIMLDGGTLSNVDDGQTVHAVPTLAGLGSTAGMKVDGVAPLVQAITPSGAAGATSASWSVQFSEAVTGVDAGDFVLTTGGSAGGQVTAVTGSGSSWTVTVGSITGTGSLRLDARAAGTGIRDAAGNAVAGGYTGGSTRPVDRDAPMLAITGGLARDGVLNAAESAAALTVQGSTTAEDGQTVTLTLGSQSHSATVSGGAWQVQLQPAELQAWAQGAQALTANVSDLAGNAASAASATLTVDTVAPTLAADTVAGDGVVNRTEAAAGIRLSGSTSAEDGQAVTVGLGSLGRQVQASGGRWSVDIGASDLAGLDDGDLPLQLLVQDAAGNVQTSRQTLALDRRAPEIVFDPMAGDGQLNAAEHGQALTLAGSASGAEDGQVLSLGIGTLARTATVTDGRWSVALRQAEVQTLADGALSVVAGVSDAAGNAASAATATLAVDTAAPLLALDAVTGDDLINLAEYTDGFVLSGTASEGTVVIVDIGTSLGVPALVDDGQWRLWISTDQLPGSSATSVPVTVQVTDAAGNTASHSRTLAMDAVAPTVLTLQLASDTGASADDGISRANGLLLRGAETGARLVYTVNGALAYDPATALQEGANTVSVLQVDAAGNVSGESAALSLTLDRAVPQLAALDLDLDAGADQATVAENTPIATPIYTAQASDATALTYSLKAGVGDVDLLAIDAATGEVTLLGEPADFESGRTAYRFTVVATDAAGNRSQQAVVAQVLNINDNAPQASLVSTEVHVDEGSTAAALGGAVALASDADGDTLVFSLVDAPVDGQGHALFVIDADSGQVRLSEAGAQVLDAESATTAYTLTVRTQDGVDAHDQAQQLSVVVDNVNDNLVAGPTDNNAADNTVAEDATVGTVVGVTALATDADLGASLSYSLSSDAGGKFTIDAATGVVTVAGALDAETATSHTITVLATSTDGSTNSADFTIAVTNVNDNPVAGPTDNNTAGNTVAEDATVGTVVGVTALATDADVGAVVSYSLQDDAGGKFTIDATTGVVTVAGALDAETATSHTITVLATSTDGSTHSADFTIAVTNVNDNLVAGPTDNNAADNTVAEHPTVGTVVGVTALATDADLGASLSYSLSSDAGGKFTIDAATGVVTVAGALDAETATSHTITVLATSTDGSTNSADFTVAVSNVNDNAPQASLVRTVVHVAEGSAVGALDGAVAQARDADGDTLVFSLVDAPVDGQGRALFAIDADSGQVRLSEAGAQVLDAESATTAYTLTVRTQDGVDAHDQTQQLTVVVDNANDNAPELQLVNQRVTIPENALAGDIAGARALAWDADGDTLVFSLVDAPVDAQGRAMFVIDPGSGQLRLTDAGAAALDFETRPLIALRVQVDDGLPGHGRTALLTLALSDVVEALPPVEQPVSRPAAVPAPALLTLAPPVVEVLQPVALSKALDASTPAAAAPVQSQSQPAADRPLPAEGARLTLGFPVPVVEARNGVATGLRLQRDLPDQQLSSGGAVRLQVPPDTFAHGDAGARVTLQAVMADGSALPVWLRFDAARGEFVGQPPEGLRGELVLKVIARDEAGRQVEATLRIRVAPQPERSGQVGRDRLSAQLQRQGVFAWKAERDRLIRLARAEATRVPRG